ncbi:MAG TPA: hypothetical protein V6C58_16715 [Allocoleopsis sp.]
MANFENLTNSWQNILNSDQLNQADNNSNPDNIYGSPKKISLNPKWDKYEESVKPMINEYLKKIGISKDYDSVTVDEIQNNYQIDPSVVEQIKQRDKNRNPFKTPSIRVSG